MLRFVLALLALLALSPAELCAQDQAPRHGAPRRLERPRPELPNSIAVFRPSLAAQLRLSALELGLSELLRSEQERFWPGALQIAIGVGLGVGAVFADDPGLRSAFTLGSFVTAARGVIQLSTRAQLGERVRTFSALPVRDQPSLFAKLRAGELALARAALVSARRRWLEGSLTMAAAAVYLPVQWAFTQSERGEYRFGTSAGDYVGLSLSLIAFASGLAQMLVKSPPERLYDEYRQLRRASAKQPP